MVWLIGMAAIVWAGVTFALPRFEQRVQVNVENSIAELNTAPVGVGVRGLTVTLMGAVENDNVRETLLAAVRNTPGVRTVRDQLTLTELADAGDPEAEIASDSSDSLTALTIFCQTMKPH